MTAPGDEAPAAPVAGPVGAVLTGGAGERMGRPKAWIEIGGRRLADRVGDVLAAAGCEPIVLVGRPPGVVPGDVASRLLVDDPPGEGPLVGLATLLESVPVRRAGHVVVAACDLPDLDLVTVARVLDPAAAGDARAVVASIEGRPVPFGWWSADVAADVRSLVDAGRRAWRSVIDVPGTVVLDLTGDGSGRALIDVDTPSGLAAVGTGSVAGMDDTGTHEIREIDVDGLAEALAAADGRAVRLIDVREPDEYDEGHVPGAVSVPLATVPDQLAAFAGDGTTFVICQAGGRSLRACEFVAARGVTDVVNVAGGTGAWIRSGRPTAGGSR